MGTTLTNGVYLPDEGERNCYAGLKTNWEILDQKVADVTALQQAVAGALHREIVESLPTTDIDPNTIYMVLSGTSATENVYNEFMHVNNAWELIGTSATDLTNYYTKSEVDGKLLLKANASDLTSHTGDTTIHVTTADKTSWNTVTAKANDSDVVHKSGDETIGGAKTFSDYIYIRALNFTNEVASPSSSSSAAMPLVTTVTYTDQSTPQSARLNLRITADGIKSLYPHEGNQYALGLTSRKWSEVHGVTYYYGSSDVEFSTKFVTTDTNQTITETKAFTNPIKIKKEIELTGNRLAYILPDFSASYSGLNLCTYSSSGAIRIGTWKVDDNDNTKHILDSSLGYLNVTVGSINSVNVVYISPRNATDSKLGDPVNKWKSFNGVEPSSLSLPSDRSARIDISSYLTNLGNGDNNAYTVPANGYIWLRFTSINSAICYSQTSGGMTNYAQTFVRFSGDGQLYAFFPVRKDDTFIVQIYTSSTAVVESAFFIPCQGNV